jgi:hypothetical protein
MCEHHDDNDDVFFSYEFSKDLYEFDLTKIFLRVLFAIITFFLVYTHFLWARKSSFMYRCVYSLLRDRVTVENFYFHLEGVEKLMCKLNFYLHLSSTHFSLFICNQNVINRYSLRTESDWEKSLSSSRLICV